MRTIEQYIETEMSGKIAIKRNTPIPALLVLAVGIGTLALLRIVEMGDSLSATCLTIGVICTALGLILTAMNLSGALLSPLWQICVPLQKNIRINNLPAHRN